MYIVKLAGKTVSVGMNVEIHGIDDFKFVVLEVLKDGLKAVWLVGAYIGQETVVPYSTFSDLGHSVEVIKTLNEGNPNQSFLAKKLGF